MSDHIKTSEQREEERRAGALDSTKDQALSKDSLHATSGVRPSSIYSTAAGSTADSALHLSSSSLSSVDSEAGSETSDHTNTTVAEMADTVRGFLNPERPTSTIVSPTSSAPPEDVALQVPAVAGDGSATVSPEATVSLSRKDRRPPKDGLD